MSHIYTARYIFPASGPPLANGIVVVNDDRIEAVEPAGTRTADVDFGNAAIIPGLVNPHTHLDLSGARGLIPPTDPDHFTDWLRGVIAYRRSRTADQVQGDIRAGLAECLRFGTTLIGDISSDGGSWEAIAEAKTRAVVFRELIGLTLQRAAIGLITANAWIEHRQATALCRLGLSPHAPYSVHDKLYHDTATMAREHHIAFAVHIAESLAELELIRHQRGPFVEFLKEMGVWDQNGLTPSLDEWLIRRVRKNPDLYIHANYLTPTKRIPRSGTIVYCPRTHAAFKHPPHPFREFRQRGVRVCLGTDSLASNPDLDILAEARFVHRRYPDFPGDQLLRMVTLDGAEALGWADEAGSLEVGKSADFVVVPLPDVERGDPHELLFAELDGERQTMFRGVMRV